MSAEEVNGIPPLVKTLLDQIRASHSNAFRLRWRGTKIPRGASVSFDGVSYPIAWTQHGIVYGISQHPLGHYARISEWTGETKDEHEMIIATDGVIEAGPGQTVEQIRFDLAVNRVKQS